MGSCYCCWCKQIDFMFKSLFVFCFARNHIIENWGITDVSDRENVVIIIEEGGFICEVGHIVST